jgi:hypothetical protein
MARIRTIKPEFFTSEDIVSLTPLARVFYIALWCEADREGRLDWKPGTLKMRYLPGDNCDIKELAEELISAGLIVLYEVGGKQYAEVPTFKTHQVINNRESESTRPARNFDASARVKAEGKEGREEEGKGKEGNAEANASGAEAPTNRDMLFATGVPLLTAAGVSDKNARSMLAGLAKKHGDSIVADAIRQTAIDRPVEPVSWLQSLMPTATNGKPSAQEALEASNRAVVERYFKNKATHAPV